MRTATILAIRHLRVAAAQLRSCARHKVNLYGANCLVILMHSNQLRAGGCGCLVPSPCPWALVPGLQPRPGRTARQHRPAAAPATAILFDMEKKLLLWGLSPGRKKAKEGGSGERGGKTVIQ